MVEAFCHDFEAHLAERLLQSLEASLTAGPVRSVVHLYSLSLLSFKHAVFFQTIS
jgi:hypothetical protein